MNALPHLIALAVASLGLACDGGTIAPGADATALVEPSGSEPSASVDAVPSWSWPDDPPAHARARSDQPRAATSDDGAAVRGITLNGRVATLRDLEILAGFERAWGVRVPAGAYWYDDRSGAAGLWGGPMRGVLGAGLGLGGALPAEASGGGDGRTTGVFINGRELHPLDVQGLAALIGQPVIPGRWWVDGQGNFGAQGQPAVGNLVAMVNARRASAGGDSYYRSDVTNGSSVFVGSGCTAVSGRTSPSSADSSYSYYVGCE